MRVVRLDRPYRLFVPPRQPCGGSDYPADTTYQRICPRRLVRVARTNSVRGDVFPSKSGEIAATISWNVLSKRSPVAGTFSFRPNGLPSTNSGEATVECGVHSFWPWASACASWGLSALPSNDLSLPPKKKWKTLAPPVRPHSSVPRHR